MQRRSFPFNYSPHVQEFVDTVSDPKCGQQPQDTCERIFTLFTELDQKGNSHYYKRETIGEKDNIHMMPKKIHLDKIYHLRWNKNYLPEGWMPD